MLLKWLNEGNPISDLNETFITLIPKINYLVSLVDYRPISLCYVLHKIFSKVLVNCFKPILAKVIGESQSAFVSNRLITDNILIALKVFHWLLKIQGEKEAFVIKIDISKAYDRVEWVFFFFFLQWMPNKIVFLEPLIGLIM